MTGTRDAVAGATGQLIFRMEAGFWSRKAMHACIDHQAELPITVTRQMVVTAAIDRIPDEDRVEIAYTDGWTAQVTETVWNRWRLIVRRTRIDNDPNLPTLFAGWRDHAFVTNRPGDVVDLTPSPYPKTATVNRDPT